MTTEDRIQYTKDLWTIDTEDYGVDIRMPIYRCLLTVATDCGYDQDIETRFPDLNGDGIVDGLDANMILEAAANIAQGLPSGLTEEQEYLADVNRDGFIDSVDASYILQFNAKVAEGLYKNNPDDWLQFIIEILGA